MIGADRQRGVDAEDEFVLVDTHVHLSTNDRLQYPRVEFPPFKTADYHNPGKAFLKKMDRAGVDYATIVQPFGLYGSDNSFHADSAIATPDRFRAICGLSPFADAPASARFWLFERGMSGLRFNIRSERAAFPDRAVDQTVAVAADAGVPVTILMNPDNLAIAARLARRFADVPFAIEHLGGAREDIAGSFESLEKLVDIANIHIKFSTGQVVARRGVERLHRLVTLFGARRLLWGSNYPVTDLGGYARTAAVPRTLLSDLSAADRRAIFGGSAMDLWFPMVRRGRAGAPRKATGSLIAE